MQGRYRLGLGGIQCRLDPVVDFLEVIADVAEVDTTRPFQGTAFDVALVDEHDRVALAHDVALRHRDGTDDPVAVRADVVLELHGLDHGDGLADAHLVIYSNADLHDGSLHRRD